MSSLNISDFFLVPPGFHPQTPPESPIHPRPKPPFLLFYFLLPFLVARPEIPPNILIVFVSRLVQGETLLFLKHFELNTPRVIDSRLNSVPFDHPGGNRLY